MKCLNCSEQIPKPGEADIFSICPTCQMLNMVCIKGKQPHLRPPCVSYCPICKGSVCVDYKEGLSCFSRNLVKADSKLGFADSIPLALGSVRNVFCHCYDLFLIVITDKGKGVVIIENEPINEFDLSKQINSTIESVEPYSSGVLLFLGSGHVYRMPYPSFFSSTPSLDQIATKCKVYSFDSVTETLAYFESGKIHRLNVTTGDDLRESTDYQVRSMIYRSKNLFYIAEKQKLYTLVVKSYDTGTQIEKTTPYLKGDGSIRASANEKYLVFSTRNQGVNQLWSGAWMHLNRRQNSWDSIQLTSAVNKLVLKDDNLIIQYSDKIEIKSIQSLESGVMNAQTDIQGLVPGSLEVSKLSDQISYLSVQANQTYACVLANGFTHNNFQSRGLNSQIVAQTWYKNRLAFIANENNRYVYIRERIDE